MKVNDLVLLYDFGREADISRVRKLHYWWLGPYKIAKVHDNQVSYWLKELDGTLLKGLTFAGRQLKKFVRHEGYFEPVDFEDMQDVNSESSLRHEDKIDLSESKENQKNIEDLGPDYVNSPEPDIGVQVIDNGVVRRARTPGRPILPPDDGYEYWPLEALRMNLAPNRRPLDLDERNIIQGRRNRQDRVLRH